MRRYQFKTANRLNFSRKTKIFEFLGQKEIQKSIAIMSFSLFIIMNILVISTPSNGYELSIYCGLSPLIWVIILVDVLCGIAFVIKNCFEDENRVRWGSIGILLIILSNFIVVLLPMLRGYAFSDSGDHLTHLGYIKDIIQNGYITPIDVYPVTHVVLSILSLILHISSDSIINLAGPLFYLLLVLFTLLISKELLPAPAAIIATVSSTVLFSYYYAQVFPMGYAFIFFPFLFFLYFKHFKTKSGSKAILIIILIILMAFFHPVASLMLTFALLEIRSSTILFESAYKVVTDQNTILSAALFFVKQNIYSYYPLISLVILLLWIWQHFQVWDSMISSVLFWFHSELLVKPISENAAEAFDKLGLDLLGQIILIIKMYGHFLIYLILSLLGATVIMKKSVHLNDINMKNLFSFSCFFITITFIWMLDNIRPLTSLSSGRLIAVLTAIYSLLVGLILYKLLENKFSYKRIFSVVFILFICSLIGIFSLYPSPYTMRSNWAVSNMQSEGSEWFLVNGNMNNSTLMLGTGPLFRYSHAFWGTQRTKDFREEYIVPDHFSYPNNENFGASANESKYMLLRSEFILSLYQDLYPQIGRFNSNDFARLAFDPTVNKLYENSEFEVFFIINHNHA